MLTKEEFIDYLNFIKDQYQKQNKLVDIFEELCPNHFCETYIYEEYESRMVDLLEKFVEDKNDNIGRFLYDADYINCDVNNINLALLPTDKDGNPLYDSPETLYDYLISGK